MASKEFTSSQNMDEMKTCPERKTCRQQKFNTLNIVLDPTTNTFQRTHTMEHENSKTICSINRHNYTSEMNLNGKCLKLKPLVNNHSYAFSAKKRDGKHLNKAYTMENVSSEKILQQNQQDYTLEVDLKKKYSKTKSHVNNHSYEFIEQKQNDEKFHEFDFKESYNASKQFNQNYLASVFTANDFDLASAMSALPESKSEIVGSKMMKHTIQQTYIKLSVVGEYNWFRLDKLNINKEVLEQKLKAGKTNIYKNIYKKMKENCPDMNEDEKVDRVMNRLLELKNFVAKKTTPKQYNTVDFHELRVVEAIFILKEVLNDYSTALRKYPDMNPALKCITGRGKHSIDGIPVLKNKVTEYLKIYQIKHIVFEGYIRVYLQNYEGENVKKTNTSNAYTKKDFTFV